MMKKYILFLVLFYLNSSYAQYFGFYGNSANLDKYIVLDSAYLKCSYKLNYLIDSTRTNYIAKDVQILLIGKNISKYYSHYTLEYNQFIKSYMEKHKNAESVPRKNNAGWSFELFKNYPAGKETVTDIGSMLQKDYLYEENLPVFDWKISGEAQTILSYTCQKATTSFRGRDYVAWFTPEIPLPNGPWKFGGLPGLILKLYDTKENFVYECNGLERLKEKELVRFYQLNYTKVKREELNKLYERYHNNHGEYQQALGVKMIDRNTGETITNPKTLRIPYNPLELK
jgi:GLPGLI family protein